MNKVILILAIAVLAGCQTRTTITDIASRMESKEIEIMDRLYKVYPCPYCNKAPHWAWGNSLNDTTWNGLIFELRDPCGAIEELNGHDMEAVVARWNALCVMHYWRLYELAR